MAAVGDEAPVTRTPSGDRVKFAEPQKSMPADTTSTVKSGATSKGEKKKFLGMGTMVFESHGNHRHDEPVKLRPDAFMDDDDKEDHCCSYLVLTEKSPVRVAWTVIITILLFYTGTIFLYRLCFLEFRIDPLAPDDSDSDLIDVNQTSPGGDSSSDNTADDRWDGWSTLDDVVSTIFWIDLFANFFFTIEDSTGREVDSLRVIAKQYLKSYFWVNLAACIPEKQVREVLLALMGTSGTSSSADPGASTQTGTTTTVGYAAVNQGVRMLRLQRMSRLARLIRLMRLGKLVNFKSKAWKTFQQMKGIRVINLTILFMWAMHLVACGWYLCASLHEDHRDTWVVRRVPDATHPNLSLIDCPPFEQWVDSMYFVLTVFGTIGFGDITPLTIGEIAYVIFTMAVGAVVHSIIISEVINVVTSNDQTKEFVAKHKELVQAFSEHTEMQDNMKFELRAWISLNARYWVSQGYDKDQMRALITGKHMPPDLLGRLPYALYDGRLLKSCFLKVCRGVRALPPRLPLLLALACHNTHPLQNDIIYEVNDYAFNIFLVLSGTFAAVAKATPQGGVPVPRTTTAAPTASTKTSCQDDDLLGEGSLLRGDSRQSLLKPPKFDKAAPPVLWPYQIFAWGSYFGDCELVQEIPRKATVRCESDLAVLLTLHKSEFKALSDEFPQFGTRWQSRALEREVVRRRLQSQLTQGVNYFHRSAMTIQKFWREFWLARLRRSQAMTADGGFHSDLQGALARSIQDATLHGEKDPPRAPTLERRPTATLAANGDLRQAVEMLRLDVQELIAGLRSHKKVSEWL